MVEQLNTISNPSLIAPAGGTSQGGGVQKTAEGKDFKDLLMESIDEVNRLQSEADQARMNLVTGKTENVAEVFTAVKKAELAFQTLMQIRNKLLDAYDEIKQMRV
jgi:flagellar hook-basal body complex protein FliE